MTFLKFIKMKDFREINGKVLNEVTTLDPKNKIKAVF